MTKIYKVGKLANPVDSYADDVYLYGDVTDMTQGEFNQYLEAQRFRLLAEHHGGIANYDAMAEAIAPTSPVTIGAFAPGVRGQVMKFMRRVSGMTKPAFPSFNFNGTQKKPANAMGSLLTDALKPVINWIFSIMIPKAAPFFLYVYLDNPYAKGILLSKKAKQTAILQKIASTAGIPYENLKASVKSSLYGILGKSPVDWLNDVINTQVTPKGSNYTATAAETAAKGDKMGPGTSTTSAKGDKIGVAPAAGLAAIVPFIPLIVGALAAVASIASKLIETVPELVGKDQLSDNQLNLAKPDETDFNDLDNEEQSENFDQTPGGFPISNSMLLLGAGALVGGYFLLKK